MTGAGPLAVDLIAGGWCSAPCLLASSHEGACECVCRGIYHGHLAHSRVDRAAAPATHAPEPMSMASTATRPVRVVDDLELLDDVFDMMATYAVDTVRVAQLASSLRGCLPEKYRGITGGCLRDRLLTVGVRVPTTNNAYPVRRSDVEDAAARIRAGDEPAWTRWLGGISDGA